MREYSFNLEAARRYGVDGAILLQGLAVWISKNRANERHLHEGRWWTYNSQEALSRLFPFWTRRQIQRIIRNLNDEGAILLGNYSEGAQHNTTWFALSDDVLELLGAGDCRSSGAPPEAEDGPEEPAATTAPNGAVPGEAAKTTAPNGAVYRTERCSLIRKQIDTTSTPYSPPPGDAAADAQILAVREVYPAPWESPEEREKAAAMLRDMRFGSPELAELLARLRAWKDSGMRVPLWRLLTGETWREEPYFAAFWGAYPRKIDKDRARRAWRKLRPDRELTAQMLRSIQEWKQCEQWQEERLIPHPATWLNNRRWEARPPAPRQGGLPREDSGPREPEEWT